jgi:hypothetical protein
MAEEGARFNVQLDERRAHVPPGTVARSLLCEPSSIVALLDSIPGAFERANQGLREINSGKGIPLDDL